MKQIDGDYTFDIKQARLVWIIPEISKDNNSGRCVSVCPSAWLSLSFLISSCVSLDFAIPAVEEDDFFPISVSFSSTSSYANLHVTSVTQAEGGKAVDFDTVTSLGVESFTIA